MPFERLFPRSFAAGAIREFAPAQSGVYGISNASEWIYIGESDNIQESLLQHLRDTHAEIGHRKPTGFVYEVCDRAGRPGRQDRLVREFDPACNRQQTRQR